MHSTPHSQHEKFDLKGSTKIDLSRRRSRRVVPSSKILISHKNFFDENDATMLVDQVEKDVAFLSTHNMMDYSLLLGVHKRNNQDTLSTKASARYISSISFETPTDIGQHGGDEMMVVLKVLRVPEKQTYFISLSTFCSYTTRAKKWKMNQGEDSW